MKPTIKQIYTGWVMAKNTQNLSSAMTTTIPKIKKEKVMSAELYTTVSRKKKKLTMPLLKEYESQEKLYNDIVSRQKQYKESVHNIVKEVWEEKTHQRFL